MKQIDLPETELLAGLAEECSELAQAALKMRRCLDKTNPTPADPDKQWAALLEEIGDVQLYLAQLRIDWETIEQYKTMKLQRWVYRLRKMREREEKA